MPKKIVLTEEAKCPKCGALPRPGHTRDYSCDSYHYHQGYSNRFTFSESPKCLRNQLAAANEAKEQAVKAYEDLFKQSERELKDSATTSQKHFLRAEQAERERDAAITAMVEIDPESETGTTACHYCDYFDRETDDCNTNGRDCMSGILIKIKALLAQQAGSEETE